MAGRFGPTKASTVSIRFSALPSIARLQTTHYFAQLPEEPMFPGRVNNYFGWHDH